MRKNAIRSNRQSSFPSAAHKGESLLSYTFPKVMFFLSAITLVLCSFSAFFPVFAAEYDALSFRDLSSLGLPTIRGEKVESLPKTDGVLSEGEYPSFCSASLENGLHLLSFGGRYEHDGLSASLFGSESASVEQKTAISYDDTYFYLAIVLTLPDKNIMTPFDHPLSSSVYAITLSLGLTDSENVVERSSALHNTYFISSEDFSCKGVTGKRVVRNADASSRMALQISSFSDTFKKKGYVDEKGVCWNGAHYTREIALKKQDGTVFLEARIPIGDVLLSVKEETRARVKSQLSRENESLCTSFYSQISLTDRVALSEGDTPLCITTGIAGKSICPL